MFAMDASGSVGESNFAKSVTFVRSVVDRLNVGRSASRVGLLTFANGAVPVFPLAAYATKAGVLAALPPHYTGGTTNTAAALRHVRESMFIREAGDRDDVRNVLVVLTDGKSQDEAETFKQAVAARDAGIHIIVVGVTNGVRMRELRAIASHPNELGKNIFAARNFDDLRAITSQLSTAICNSKCGGDDVTSGGVNLTL